MINCEFCGKPFETEQQLRAHKIQCRKKYEAVAQEAALQAAFDNRPELKELKEKLRPEQPSIPLSACPPELAYMRKGQLFLRVAGRVDGDRFLIESTKVVR